MSSRRSGSDEESPAVVQPGEGVLHDPAVAAQPGTLLGLASCDQQGPGRESRFDTRSRNERVSPAATPPWARSRAPRAQARAHFVQKRPKWAGSPESRMKRVCLTNAPRHFVQRAKGAACVVSAHQFATWRYPCTSVGNTRRHPTRVLPETLIFGRAAPTSLPRERPEVTFSNSAGGLSARPIPLRRQPFRLGQPRGPAATRKPHGCPQPRQPSNPPAQTSGAEPVGESFGLRSRRGTSSACSATPAR